MPIKNLNSISVGESTSIDVREIAWNPDQGTFDMGLLNGVVLQSGQELHFYGKATEAISNGDAVMFAGAQGDHLLMSKATQAAINANPEYFIGVATQDFTTNQYGYITSFGNVRELDTTIYRDGDPSAEGKILYFDSSGVTAGALTVTQPSAPNAKIRVAAVTRDHVNEGSIFVRPMIEPTLDQLKDASISGQVDGDILVWDNTNEYWFNDSTLNVDYTNNRIGIGTTSPSYNLDVNGNAGIRITTPSDLPLRVISTDGFSAIEIADNTHSYYVGTTSDDFIIRSATDGNIDRLTIQGSTGNVGIGTTSPSSELDVNGDGRFSGELILNTNATYLRAKNTSGAVTRIHGINASNIEYIGSIDTLMSGTLIGNNTSYVSLRVGNNEKLKVDATQTTIRGTGTGNAGILELRDGDSARKLILKSSYSGIGWSSINTQTGDLRIGVEGSDVIHIEGSNNNVGIGTTSPYTKLEVVGTISSGAGSSATNLGMEFGGLLDPAAMPSQIRGVIGALNNGTGVSAGSIGYQPRTGVGASHIFFTEQSEKMRITSTGNVGIGTTSPSQKLDVVGKISINDGGQSVYIGYNTGFNDDGSDNRNVGVGHASMVSNTSGYFNTGTGYNSLRLNTTGYYNSAFGYASLYRNTTGYANAASGPLALYNNTEGNNNTATGYQALYSNQIGDKNTAQGAQALYQSTADQNTAFGYRASFGNTTGINNSSFGVFALNSMSTGNYNTGLGSSSMYLSTSGNYNTAVGYQTLYYMTSGSQNATLGHKAGFSIASGARNTASDKSVFIGADSRPNAVGEENQIAIGYQAIGLGSDTTVIGNSSTKITELKGAVAIGTSSPSYPLDVNGDGRFTGDVRANSFITTSDADLKTNIKDIPSTKLTLSYKEYALKDDTSGRKRYGILADDIKKSYPELVHYNEKGQAGVDYISLLVKKVAELESEISLLNKRLDAAGIK